MRAQLTNEFFNVGMGEDVTINELVAIICRVIGFSGEIAHDLSKPDGTPRKLLDVSRLRALGWAPTISLEQGIEMVYKQIEADKIF